MKLIKHSSLQTLLLTVAVLLATSGLAQAWGSATPLTDLLLEQGRYGSGLASLELEDPSRPTPANGDFPGASTRELPTKVWYPAADRDADQEEGALPGNTLLGFPLIVFGHGISSEGLEGSFVAAHLATHGYVVVAPDFPLSKATAPGGPTAADIAGQAGDVIFITVALQDSALQSAFPVASLINFDRIGVLGYSLGGATMSLAGSHPSIDAVATLAPATCPLYQVGVPTTIDKPSFILQGSTDAICKPELNAEPFFDSSGDPRHLVEIDNGSHGGFLASAPFIEAAYPTTPLDGVICYALMPTLGNDPIAQACEVCNPPPSTLQLISTRQHELTRAGVLAFFNAYLRCRPLALAYLKHVYDVENSELASTYSGGFSDGLQECLEQ
jgi:pimeloyl-ACP methyl ester carboxylesterase